MKDPRFEYLNTTLQADISQADSTIAKFVALASDDAFHALTLGGEFVIAAAVRKVATELHLHITLKENLDWTEFSLYVQSKALDMAASHNPSSTTIRNLAEREQLAVYAQYAHKMSAWKAPADRFSIEWGIDDILQQCSWLTRDQAITILAHLKKNYDRNYGISWDTIADTVHIKFPKPEVVPA